MSHYQTRLRNISQLVCISNKKELFKTGAGLKDLAIIENAAVIIDNNGLIHDLGTEKDLQEKYKDSTFSQDIDCHGNAVIPGFVDAHTHPICPGDRVHEWVMKLEGATYMQIMEKGGGIAFTAKNVREASEESLIEQLIPILKKFEKVGTTTVEVKTGYGQDAENELKMLRVIKKAKSLTPLDLVSNYLGAHSFPKGMNEEQATRDILESQIPAVKKAIDNGEIDPEFIDVFCEKGVYERENTKKILEAGQKIGLLINFHGDEIKFTDSGTLGGELGARAISHLENLDQAGIESMAKNQTAGVFLPTTHYLLKLKDPPVRDFIANGGIFALGSDFNPNAYCMSMPLVMNLSCVNFKTYPSEALVAATLNSAYAINRSQTHGSIEVGKVADLVLLECPRWDHIVYQFGQIPIWQVLKRGKVLYNSGYIQ